jgi:hypothetical protein
MNMLDLVPSAMIRLVLSFSNYGLPLDYEIVAKSGLESDEIRKPLFCWMIALVYDESILTDRNKFVS